MGDERKFTGWQMWRMGRGFAATATILGLAELVRWLALHLRWEKQPG